MTGTKTTAVSGAGSDGGSHHCITCGDDADPVTVISINWPKALAVCTTDDGTRSTVETALVEPLAVGDRLLVHAGTAIAHIPPGHTIR